MPRAVPIKPNNRTKLSNQPLESSTMYKDTYVPYQYKKPEKHAYAVYAKPTGAMNTSSTYRTDYLEKKTVKPTLAKPDYHRVTTDVPFDGNTVHNETYKHWQVPKMESVYPPKQGIRTAGKFEHVTTVQHDYPGYYANLGREAVRPPEATLKSGTGQMSDETTHRNAFTQKYTEPTKSAKPVQNRVHHDDAFAHKTTNQFAYTWPDGSAADTCKPVMAAFKSNQPFDDDTTHKMTYKQWNAPRVERCKPQVAWRPPVDSFARMTTNRHDFQGKHTPIAKSARPSSVRASPGEFSGTTTHNEAFKPWGLSVRERCQPTTGYRPSTAPFYGQTTQAADFRGERGFKPNMCAPKENGLGLTGDQAFSTCYTDDYKKKQVPLCPAIDLTRAEQAKSREGYTFARDTEGHQFYYPPNRMGMGERIETVALA